MRLSILSVAEKSINHSILYNKVYNIIYIYIYIYLKNRCHLTCIVIGQWSQLNANADIWLAELHETYFKISGISPPPHPLKCCMGQNYVFVPLTHIASCSSCNICALRATSQFACWKLKLIAKIHYTLKMH